MEIKATECALKEKKQALCDIQKLSKDIRDKEEGKDIDKDDNVSVSTVDTQSVCYSFNYLHYFRH